MCVVSNVGDMGREMWPKPWDMTPSAKPWVPAVPLPMMPNIFAPPNPYNGPTREQFQEFLELMRAARKFDKATGQEDCPAEEKIGWMYDLADYLGMDRKYVDSVLA